MTRSPLAGRVLRPYLDLETGKGPLPLHAQGLSLAVQGGANPAVETLVLLGAGMWMPAGYRRRLLASDVFGALEPEIGRPRPLVLARLSEYETLARSAGDDPLERFLAAQASSLLTPAQPGGGAGALRGLLGESTLPPELRFVVRVAAAGLSIRAGKLGEAAALQRSALKELPAVSPCLGDLLSLVVEALEAAALRSRRRDAQATARLEACLSAAERLRPKGQLESWAVREFARRRFEHLVRWRLEDDVLPDCSGLARRAVQLDESDARAWLLLGDALLAKDAEEAAGAYEMALCLDPTLAGIAGRSAGQAWERAGRTARAMTRYAASLDVEPNDAEAREALRLLAPRRRHPALQPRKNGRLFTMLRPFFDLSFPAKVGPSMGYAPSVAWERCFAPGSSGLPYLQRTLPPAFRSALCAEARLPEYDVWDPTLLPRELWTDQWARLADGLRRFSGQSPERRQGLCRILIALAMYEPVLFYLGDSAICPRDCSPEQARLALTFAFAEHMLLIGSPPDPRSIGRFEAVAERAPRGSSSAFSAALFLAVHTARHRSDLKAARAWAMRAREALDRLALPADRRMKLFWESRFLRAAAYVPFLEGDYDGSLGMLAQARRIVEPMRLDGPSEKAVGDDNLHSILESTMKVQQHRGDLAAALRTGQELVAHEPWDSKCRLELANVHYQLEDFEAAADGYLEAAYLGPPGTEISAFLAGCSLERTGKRELAMRAYLESLAVDPEGRSSREGLERCRRPAFSVRAPDVV